MKYVVVHRFKDLEDNNYIYSKLGDEYPRKGLKIEDISEKRIKELSTKNNKIGEILIKRVEETEKTEETTEKTTEVEEETAEVEEETTEVEEETAEVEEETAEVEEETAENKGKTRTNGKNKNK